MYFGNVKRMNKEEIKHELKKVDFNSSLIKLKNFYPDYIDRYPKGQSWGVVARDNKGKLLITNHCSSQYNLTHNRDFFPVFDMLLDRGKRLHVQAKTNIFNTSINVAVLPHKKLMKGDIIPVLNLSDTITGKGKAKFDGNLYRIWCDNLCSTLIKNESFSYTFKHTTENKIDFKEMLEKIDEYLGGFRQVREAIEILKNTPIKVKDIPEVSKELIEGTQYPSKQIGLARSIAIQEFRDIKRETNLKNGMLNLWLVYNGLNYILNHDRELVQKNLMKKPLALDAIARQKTDQRILKSVYEFARVES